MAAAVSYVVPTLFILWAAALLHLANEGAELNSNIADIKGNVANKLGDLLAKAGLREGKAVESEKAPVEHQ